MDECFMCGISGTRTFLFDAVSDKGIVKVCRNCLQGENLPLVKKIDFIEKPKSQTVYERLSRISGVKEKKENSKSGLLIKQELNLRSIVEENFKKTISLKSEPPENLIRNFHWIIMRIRRAKHLTQKQLAEAIGEPEMAIKMAEMGVLPEFNSRFIQKIEDYLKINLRKRQYVEITEKPTSFRVPVPPVPANKDGEEIDFDITSAKDLRIEDLRKMKKKKEKGVFGKDKLEDKKEKVEEDEFDYEFEDIEEEFNKS